MKASVDAFSGDFKLKGCNMHTFYKPKENDDKHIKSLRTFISLCSKEMLVWFILSTLKNSNSIKIFIICDFHLLIIANSPPPQKKK